MSKFILLSKQSYRPRKQFPHVFELETLNSYLSNIPDDEIAHIDLETTGLDVRSDTIACLGIAFSGGHFCIDTRDDEILEVCIRWLATRSGGYGAFNGNFDALFITNAMMKIFPGAPIYKYLEKFVEDSMVSFKFLANEDKSSRSLEVAIEDVLGWPVSCYQKTWLKEKLDAYELEKGDMSKLMDVELQGFMSYCSLDAEASYQLEQYCTQFKTIAKFDSLVKVQKLYIQDIRLAIEGHICGLAIDMPKLHAYKKELDEDTAEALEAFVSHPEVAPRIKLYNQVNYGRHHAPIIKDKKIWSKKSDQPHLHPDIWTKGYKVKLAKWEEEFGPYFRMERSITESSRAGEARRFSPTSDADLLWMFYGKAKKCTGQESDDGLIEWAVTRQPHPEAENPWERDGIVEAQLPEGRSLTWSMTDGGELPIDQDFRGMFGDHAKLLNKWVTLNGRQCDVDKLIEAAGDEGRIYPTKRPLSTVTGRSGSSGAIGMLTLMKVARYMECFISDPGYSFLQLDFSSLEDVILAELSKDPMMWEVYGSGKPHCGYLYWGAVYDPKAVEIQKIYDINNPTEEKVAEAKVKFKPVRKAWKVLKLANNYGAGAVKVQRNMAAKENLWMTLPEVKGLLKSYKTAVAGTETWKASLVAVWQSHSGFIFNAMGRPMCVPDKYEKDLASRKIQSTGRDILSLLEFFIHRIRVRDNLDLRPVIEIHDEFVGQIRDDQIEQGRACVQEALQEVNRILGWGIKLKAPEEVTKTFQGFKQADD